MKNERLNAEQFLDRILYISKPDEFERERDVQEALDVSMNASIVSNEPEIETNAPKGICISCKSRHCDIILMPCFDIVVCSQCWTELKTNHETNCEIKYKKNQRKKESEKKKVLCPCCGKIVKQSNEFHMATIQS